ncbi:MAG: methyl-accepting chemotaxis protein [Clostridium sp.]|nr:methyl-accepting chemotaxis protein [Clostridium sp.]
MIIMGFVIVGTNLLTYQTMESDANIVNHSGKLRATSYKMAQLSNVIIASKSDKTTNELNENIMIFDEILLDLSKGNSEKGLSELTHEPTIERLKVISEKWNSRFKVAYQSIIDSKDKDQLVIINNEIADYVDSINDMVTGYSKYSSSKVSMAKLTNSILSLVILVIGLLSFIVLNKGIITPISSLMKDLKSLSEGNGDLTKRIEVKSKDEIGETIGYFNQFVGSIHEIVSEISKISTLILDYMTSISTTTEELTRATEIIAAASLELAEGSELQNEDLEKLNYLAEKIKLDIETVSEMAMQTLKSSEKSQDSVEKGDKQVILQSEELNKFVNSIQNASYTVEDLTQSSAEIKAIVEVIYSISSQTNLLALNASIEAARAGEAGRGFSVVAEEIRKLSEETTVSAKKISEIVINIGDKTLNVKDSMNELVNKTKIQEKSLDLLKEELKDILKLTSVTLKESTGIMGISSKVNDDFIEITQSTKGIRGVAEKNSENTQEVAASVQEQTASFEEVSSNISFINEMAADLTKIVGRFKI